MEIESTIQKQNLIYLATVEGDQPRVRPVTLIHIDNDFYVITGARGGKDAKKLGQIKENPNVEYYLTLVEGEERGFIRGEATATITENQKLKERLYNEIDWVQNYFKDPSDPDYFVLRIIPRAYSYRRPSEYEIMQVNVT